MPSRVIQASVTSGANIDKVGGTYITFGSILSDTGVVSGNYEVESADLYLSYHRTYSEHAYLNVIFGGSGGSVVAKTTGLGSENSSHAETYSLTSLSSSLITAGVSSITLGVVATSSTSGNKINVRDSCTLTLTINYKEKSSSGGSSGGSSSDPYEFRTRIKYPDLALSSYSAAPGAQVTLSWAGAYVYDRNTLAPIDSDRITKYDIWRAKSDPEGYDSYNERIAYRDSYGQSNYNSGSHVVTAPTVNGETYYYRIALTSFYGAIYSEEDHWKSPTYVALTCTYSAHTAPTELKLDVTNAAPAADVLLSWSGVTAGTNNDITGYRIYRTADPADTYELLTTVTTNSTSGSVYVTAPTENGAAYYYKVLTVGSLEGMDSAMSAATATLTCTYSVPSAPTNVTLEGATELYSQPGQGVLLAWSGAVAGVNNPIVGYDIYRDGSLLEAGLDPSVSSYIVTAHEEVGQQHQYSIVTRGTYSDSAQSKASVVKSYSDPVAPTNLFVTNETPPAGSRFRLSWSGAAAGGYNDILGYNVYRAMTEYGKRTQIAAVSSADTFASCYVTAPTVAGIYYYLWVETVGSYSVSGMSDVCMVICSSEGDGESGYGTTVIVPQPGRLPKRGFLLGDYDTAAKGWTLAGWSFPEPKPQTNYVTVPGRSKGPLDQSTALTNGDPCYDIRPLTIRLERSDGTRLDRYEHIEELVSRLHGMRVDIVFPDDKTRYAVGRLKVQTEYNDMAHAALNITGDCEPWRYSQQETRIALQAFEEENTAVLFNSGRRVIVPTVEVSGVGAYVYLECGGREWGLEAGTYRLPELTLARGNTLLTYHGYGDIIFTYREAVI